MRLLGAPDEDLEFGAQAAEFAQTLHTQGAQMAEKRNGAKKRDYSCEILSLIVLVILSDLSHFWLIMIAICIGIVFWGGGVLLAHLVLSKVWVLPWRFHVRKKGDSKFGDFENEVFQPRKIRQNVDC